MQKWNKKIIFLSLIVTSLVLFGGFFGYQFLSVEKPLHEWAEGQEGISIRSIQQNGDEMIVDMTFTDHPGFGKDVLKLKRMFEESHKGKRVEIRINPEQSIEHPWWLQSSFLFIEAIEHQAYSSIKVELDRGLEAGEYKDATLTMNQEHLFLYFKLTDGDEVYLAFSLQNE